MAEMGFAGLSHLFVTVFLYYSANFMVIPAITDVTMSALCPAMDECSIAIYLTGFQQAIIGLGTLVMMPIIGNLSDEYGRKTMLALPMSLSIIPLAILAYRRTKQFFYVYYVLRILTSMFCEGSVQCLSLAYVADNIPEGRRASAFGILSGIVSIAFICGTLTARFLSTALTFQVSATVAVLAALYMKVFVRDSIGGIDAASLRTISKKTNNVVHFDDDSSRKIRLFSRIPSVEEILYLLRISTTFSQVTVVAFFNNLAESALSSSLLYFLKARFHFSKDQFADLLLISGFAGAISQLVLMPILVPFLGEEKLLMIGLFASCTHMFLYAIAWSSWVPYVASMFSILLVFAPPCLRSIASKQVGPTEQGKAQGCLSGICSLANIISPLALTPLTALFLSKNAPFHFPGFSIMSIGFFLLIAFIQSTRIRVDPPISSYKISNSDYMEA
ncbi:tetracycline resistance protein, class A-like [Telopea speciosissima]|uniref:tetracycline resistance protein, class A-like n=1 Tax=Telopea speciosissima TaxID=54955 RepID=UPI001CC6F27D|nr:tetracycline resistance protein, class A-like [Telopea speciosissima]